MGCSPSAEPYRPITQNTYPPRASYDAEKAVDDYFKVSAEHYEDSKRRSIIAEQKLRADERRASERAAQFQQAKNILREQLLLAATARPDSPILPNLSAWPVEPEAINKVMYGRPRSDIRLANDANWCNKAEYKAEVRLSTCDAVEQENKLPAIPPERRLTTSKKQSVSLNPHQQRLLSTTSQRTNSIPNQESMRRDNRSQSFKKQSNASSASGKQRAAQPKSPRNSSSNVKQRTFSFSNSPRHSVVAEKSIIQPCKSSKNAESASNVSRESISSNLDHRSSRLPSIQVQQSLPKAIEELPEMQDADLTETLPIVLDQQGLEATKSNTSRCLSATEEKASPSSQQVSNTEITTSQSKQQKIDTAKSDINQQLSTTQVGVLPSNQQMIHPAKSKTSQRISTTEITKSSSNQHVLKTIKSNTNRCLSATQVEPSPSNQQMPQPTKSKTSQQISNTDICTKASNQHMLKTTKSNMNQRLSATQVDSSPSNQQMIQPAKSKTSQRISTTKIATPASNQQMLETTNSNTNRCLSATDVEYSPSNQQMLQPTKSKTSQRTSTNEIAATASNQQVLETTKSSANRCLSATQVEPSPCNQQILQPVKSKTSQRMSNSQIASSASKQQILETMRSNTNQCLSTSQIEAMSSNQQMLQPIKSKASQQISNTQIETCASKQQILQAGKPNASRCPSTKQLGVSASNLQTLQASKSNIDQQISPSQLEACTSRVIVQPVKSKTGHCAASSRIMPHSMRSNTNQASPQELFRTPPPKEAYSPLNAPDFLQAFNMQSATSMCVRGNDLAMRRRGCYAGAMVSLGPACMSDVQFFASLFMVAEQVDGRIHAVSIITDSYAAKGDSPVIISGALTDQACEQEKTKGKSKSMLIAVVEPNSTASFNDQQTNSLQLTNSALENSERCPETPSPAVCSSIYQIDRKLSENVLDNRTTPSPRNTSSSQLRKRSPSPCPDTSQRTTSISLSMRMGDGPCELAEACKPSQGLREQVIPSQNLVTNFVTRASSPIPESLLNAPIGDGFSPSKSQHKMTKECSSSQRLKQPCKNPKRQSRSPSPSPTIALPQQTGDSRVSLQHFQKQQGSSVSIDPRLLDAKRSPSQTHGSRISVGAEFQAQTPQPSISIFDEQGDVGDNRLCETRTPALDLSECSLSFSIRNEALTPNSAMNRSSKSNSVSVDVSITQNEQTCPQILLNDEMHASGQSMEVQKEARSCCSRSANRPSKVTVDLSLDETPQHSACDQTRSPSIDMDEELERDMNQYTASVQITSNMGNRVTIGLQSQSRSPSTCLSQSQHMGDGADSCAPVCCQ
ncbi:streptococcal hemagglutinin-like [Watersipora subatra]|uniref:streptococcal hemagglutinin-like n=1 Tax=Watersipora subatra TaxID=2589382 RepID=UPI00355AF052